MRLELDSNGYVCTVVFGCETGSCAEYTGLVPTQPEEYASYADWADRAQIQSYRLENGNLTYDAARAATLCDEKSVTPLSVERVTELGIVKAIRDVFYPVGSIYVSLNDVDPAELFGGTWQRIENRFLLAAGTNAAGEVGGAESYDLSVQHRHIAPIGYNSTSFGAVNINGTASTGNGKAYRTAKTDNSGTLSENITAAYTSNSTISDTIPTMPPYLVVYMWQRIADPVPEGYVALNDSTGNEVFDATDKKIMVKVE